MRVHHVSFAILSAIPFMLCSSAACAAEGKVVQVVRWSEAKAATGTLVEDPEKVLGQVLMLDAPKGERTQIRLVTLEKPSVGPPAYVLRGRVRYEHVGGTGYLELLNYFSGYPRPFFTRTMSDSGPDQSLSGTSDWRAVELPFYVAGDQMKGPERPSKLELNVMLPEGGAVYLSDLELVQLDKGWPYSAGGAWWSARATGFIGAIGGSLLGCLGGLVGTLTGIGKARRLVMSVINGCTVFGALALIAGLTAVILGQPYHVYFPLLGMGGISLGVFGGLRTNVGRQFQEREVRRMQALDAAG
jgi:hypothetical protein